MTPVLQDKKDGVLVSNESSDILKFLAVHFKTSASARPCPSYFPEAQRDEIDRISNWVLSDLGKRVYMCVSAKSQVSLASKVKCAHLPHSSRHINMPPPLGNCKAVPCLPAQASRIDTPSKCLFTP